MNIAIANARDNFRSYPEARRLPARAMDPIVDPAGWLANELQNLSTWSYALSGDDVDELRAAVAAFKRSGKPIVEVAQENFPLDAFGATLCEVRRELLDGRGIIMMRGFPVDAFDREETAIAYLGLGCYLGTPMSQNKHGHILGHVKDLGGDYGDAKTRGYMTNAEMRFHSDGCDYVGLLCLQTAKSGGESRVASSVTVYNRMLAQRPDLVKALTEDFYRSRSGEISPGQLPFFKQPIFSFFEGYFSAIGVGAVIDKAQKLPGVPPFTTAQKEAVALYRQTVDECAVDIGFERGDIQFLNNWVMLHTRRGYEDWDDPARKRHLLRLWLNDPQGRAVPPEQRLTRTGQGVRIAGVPLVAPLDVEG